jgi:hypothetical protein
MQAVRSKTGRQQVAQWLKLPPVQGTDPPRMKLLGLRR